MDSGWLISVVALFATAYGFLSKPVQRNLKYLVNSFEIFLCSFLWFLILISLVFESTIKEVCSGSISWVLFKITSENITPDNPLPTVGFLFSSVVVVFLSYWLPKKSIVDYFGFIGSLDLRISKKEYSDVVEDLEKYHLNLLDKYNNSKSKVSKKYKRYFENFLDRASENEEFISELGKYPDICYNFLNSSIIFNKYGFWNMYLRYLLTNKNSALYSELKYNYENNDLENNFYVLGLFNNIENIFEFFNGFILEFEILKHIRNIKNKPESLILEQSCNYYFEKWNSPIYAGIKLNEYVFSKLLENNYHYNRKECSKLVTLQAGPSNYSAYYKVLVEIMPVIDEYGKNYHKTESYNPPCIQHLSSIIESQNNLIGKYAKGYEFKFTGHQFYDGNIIQFLIYSQMNCLTSILMNNNIPRDFKLRTLELIFTLYSKLAKSKDELEKKYSKEFLEFIYRELNFNKISAEYYKELLLDMIKLQYWFAKDMSTPDVNQFLESNYPMDDESFQKFLKTLNLELNSNTVVNFRKN